MQLTLAPFIRKDKKSVQNYEECAKKVDKGAAKQKVNQLWLLDIDKYKEKIHNLIGYLDKNELARAESFGNAEKKQEYIVTRAIMKILIQRYTKRPFSKISLSYNDNGKPFMKNKLFAGNIKFNSSHSGKLAIIALSSLGDVGCDIEYMRKNIDYENIARRFFSPDEQKYITGKNIDDCRENFFRIWTAKESFIKMLGSTVAKDLKNSEININGDFLSLTNFPQYHIYHYKYNDYMIAVASPLSDKPETCIYNEE